MSAPRWARLLIGAATLVALAAPAHAWTLAYDVPAGCDDAASFRARAEAQRVHDGEVAGLAVRVHAWLGEDGRWHVQVAVGSDRAAAGVRELDGTSCSEVTNAAALIVAFSLDGVQHDAPAAGAPARPLPTRVPPARDPEPTLAVRATEPPVWLSLALAGGVDAGTLPSTAPGLRAELALGWRRMSLVLGVARWARVSEVYDDGTGMSASAWQGHVALRVRVWRGLEVAGAFEIGQLDAEATGVFVVIPRTIGWQGAGGGLLWQARLWRDLEYAFEIDGLRPFVQPNFEVDGRSRFRPELCLRLWSGIRWRFF